MATHFSIPAWRIPWTEGPGGLPSIRWQSQNRLSAAYGMSIFPSSHFWLIPFPTSVPLLRPFLILALLLSATKPEVSKVGMCNQVECKMVQQFHSSVYAWKQANQPENRYSDKYMYMHAHSSSMHSSQKIETDQMSLDRWWINCGIYLIFVVVQLLSRVQLFSTPWTSACQVSMSSTISWSLLKFRKRLWRWERLKAGGEGDDRGWDGWMASPTQWTWIWVNSRSWWWTGRPGLLRSMGLQRVGHDRVTELNWVGDTFFFLFPFFLFSQWYLIYSAIKRNELLLHATRRVNFENIMLSERNQNKSSHIMIPFI